MLIAGLGVAGSYLYRRLHDSGFDVMAYDPRRQDFYLPCGYALNEHVARSYLANIGMDVDDYILSRADTVTIDSGKRTLEFDSCGLCTVDKNLLLRDMVLNIPFKREKAPNNDIIIDATGISRAYLGPVENDLTMFTKEFLCQQSEHRNFYFRYFNGGHGYYWEFPLGRDYHIGAGSDMIDIMNNSLNVTHYMKVVSRKIRLCPLFHNISSGRVIGVGESIGTVSPITGEGIMPSIESAEILFQVLRRANDMESILVHYSNEISRFFRRYNSLYSLLLDSRNGKLMKISNVMKYRAVKEDFRHFGIEINIRGLVKAII